jgi:hypothetical protein
VKTLNNIIVPQTENQIDARNLVNWLSLPGAEDRYPGASIITAYLRILLGSCTPDVEELLADEIEAIKAIVLGSARS